MANNRKSLFRFSIFLLNENSYANRIIITLFHAKNRNTTKPDLDQGKENCWKLENNDEKKSSHNRPWKITGKTERGRGRPANRESVSIVELPFL
jgi:hypothetical protein